MVLSRSGTRRISALPLSLRSKIATLYSGKRSFWKKRFDRCLLELFKAFFYPMKMIMSEPCVVLSPCRRFYKCQPMYLFKVNLWRGEEEGKRNLLYTRAAHLAIILLQKTKNDLRSIFYARSSFTPFVKIFNERFFFLWESLCNEKWVGKVYSLPDVADGFELSFMQQDKFFYERLMNFFNGQYIRTLKFNPKRRRLD